MFAKVLLERSGRKSIRTFIQIKFLINQNEFMPIGQPKAPVFIHKASFAFFEAKVFPPKNLTHY